MDTGKLVITLTGAPHGEACMNTVYNEHGVWKTKKSRVEAIDANNQKKIYGLTRDAKLYQIIKSNTNTYILTVPEGQNRKFSDLNVLMVLIQMLYPRYTEFGVQSLFKLVDDKTEILVPLFHSTEELLTTTPQDNLITLYRNLPITLGYESYDKFAKHLLYELDKQNQKESEIHRHFLSISYHLECNKEDLSMGRIYMQNFLFISACLVYHLKVDVGKTMLRFLKLFLMIEPTLNPLIKHVPYIEDSFDRKKHHKTESFEEDDHDRYMLEPDEEEDLNRTLQEEDDENENQEDKETTISSKASTIMTGMSTSTIKSVSRGKKSKGTRQYESPYKPIGDKLNYTICRGGWFMSQAYQQININLINAQFPDNISFSIISDTRNIEPIRIQLTKFYKMYHEIFLKGDKSYKENSNIVMFHHVFLEASGYATDSLETITKQLFTLLNSKCHSRGLTEESKRNPTYQNNGAKYMKYEDIKDELAAPLSQKARLEHCDKLYKKFYNAMRLEILMSNDTFNKLNQHFAELANNISAADYETCIQNILKIYANILQKTYDKETLQLLQGLKEKDAGVFLRKVLYTIIATLSTYYLDDEKDLVSDGELRDWMGDNAREIPAETKTVEEQHNESKIFSIVDGSTANIPITMNMVVVFIRANRGKKSVQLIASLTEIFEKYIEPDATNSGDEAYKLVKSRILALWVKLLTNEFYEADIEEMKNLSSYTQNDPCKKLASALNPVVALAEEMKTVDPEKLGTELKWDCEKAGTWKPKPKEVEKMLKTPDPIPTRILNTLSDKFKMKDIPEWKPENHSFRKFMERLWTRYVDNNNLGEKYEALPHIFVRTLPWGSVRQKVLLKKFGDTLFDVKSKNDWKTIENKLLLHFDEKGPRQLKYSKQAIDFLENLNQRHDQSILEFVCVLKEAIENAYGVSEEEIDDHNSAISKIACATLINKINDKSLTQEAWKSQPRLILDGHMGELTEYLINQQATENSLKGITNMVANHKERQVMAYQPQGYIENQQYRGYWIPSANNGYQYYHQNYQQGQQYTYQPKPGFSPRKHGDQDSSNRNNRGIKNKTIAQKTYDIHKNQKFKKKNKFANMTKSGAFKYPPNQIDKNVDPRSFIPQDEYRRQKFEYQKKNTVKGRKYPKSIRNQSNYVRVNQADVIGNTNQHEDDYFNAYPIEPIVYQEEGKFQEVYMFGICGEDDETILEENENYETSDDIDWSDIEDFDNTDDESCENKDQTLKGESDEDIEWESVLDHSDDDVDVDVCTIDDKCSICNNIHHPQWCPLINDDLDNDECQSYCYLCDKYCGHNFLNCDKKDKTLWCPLCTSKTPHTADECESPTFPGATIKNKFLKKMVEQHGETVTNAETVINVGVLEHICVGSQSSNSKEDQAYTVLTAQAIDDPDSFKTLSFHINAYIELKEGDKDQMLSERIEKSNFIAALNKRATQLELVKCPGALLDTGALCVVASKQFFKQNLEHEKRMVKVPEVTKIKGIGKQLVPISGTCKIDLMIPLRNLSNHKLAKYPIRIKDVNVLIIDSQNMTAPLILSRSIFTHIANKYGVLFGKTLFKNKKLPDNSMIIGSSVVSSANQLAYLPFVKRLTKEELTKIGVNTATVVESSENKKEEQNTAVGRDSITLGPKVSVILPSQATEKIKLSDIANQTKPNFKEAIKSKRVAFHAIPEGCEVVEELNKFGEIVLKNHTAEAITLFRDMPIMIIHESSKDTQCEEELVCYSYDIETDTRVGDYTDPDGLKIINTVKNGLLETGQAQRAREWMDSESIQAAETWKADKKTLDTEAEYKVTNDPDKKLKINEKDQVVDEKITRKRKDLIEQILYQTPPEFSLFPKISTEMSKAVELDPEFKKVAKAYFNSIRLPEVKNRHKIEAIADNMRHIIFVNDGLDTIKTLPKVEDNQKFFDFPEVFFDIKETEKNGETYTIGVDYKGQKLPIQFGIDYDKIRAKKLLAKAIKLELLDPFLELAEDEHWPTIPNVSYKLEFNQTPETITIDQCPPYRVSEDIEPIAWDLLQHHIKRGVMEVPKYPGEGKFFLPLRFIPKKAKNQCRQIIDPSFHSSVSSLNEQTLTLTYPTPVPEDVHPTFKNAKWGCALDIKKFYDSISLHKDSFKYHLVRVPQNWVSKLGTSYLQYKSLIPGAKNSPAVAQYIMENALVLPFNKSNLKIGKTKVFIDDVVLTGDSVEECENGILVLLAKIKQMNLKLGADKAVLMTKKVEFLGTKYDLKNNTYKISKSYTDVIENWSEDMLKTKKKNIQKFVGILTHIASSQPVLKSFSYNIIKTIGKTDKPVWTPEATHSFKMIKKLVSSSLEKTHIQYDIPEGENKFSHSVVAYYDASNAYASYVVMQFKPKMKRFVLIDMGVKALPASIRTSTSAFKAEAFALSFFCSKNKHLIVNTKVPVLLLGDNMSLVNLSTSAHRSGQYAEVVNLLTNQSRLLILSWVNSSKNLADFNSRLYKGYLPEDADSEGIRKDHSMFLYEILRNVTESDFLAMLNGMPVSKNHKIFQQLIQQFRRVRSSDKEDAQAYMCELEDEINNAKIKSKIKSEEKMYENMYNYEEKIETKLQADENELNKKLQQKSVLNEDHLLELISSAKFPQASENDRKSVNDRKLVEVYVETRAKNYGPPGISSKNRSLVADNGRPNKRPDTDDDSDGENNARTRESSNAEVRGKSTNRSNKRSQNHSYNNQSSNGKNNTGTTACSDAEVRGRSDKRSDDENDNSDSEITTTSTEKDSDVIILSDNSDDEIECARPEKAYEDVYEKSNSIYDEEDDERIVDRTENKNLEKTNEKAKYKKFHEMYHPTMNKFKMMFNKSRLIDEKLYQEVIDECDICQSLAIPITRYNKVDPLPVHIDAAPGQIFYLDYCFCDTPGGKKPVLTATDAASNYIMAVAVNSRNKWEVIEFLSQIIKFIGSPGFKIISDNEKSFESKSVQEFCKDFSIVWEFTNPLADKNYNLSESVGNRMLKQNLKKLSKVYALKMGIMRAVMLHNLTPSKVLGGFAPFELMMGKRINYKTLMTSPEKTVPYMGPLDIDYRILGQERMKEKYKLYGKQHCKPGRKAFIRMGNQIDLTTRHTIQSVHDNYAIVRSDEGKEYRRAFHDIFPTYTRGHGDQE